MNWEFIIGLTILGALAVVGSYFAPVSSHDGLFAVLGALGGYMAGRATNGARTPG